MSNMKTDDGMHVMLVRPEGGYVICEVVDTP